MYADLSVKPGPLNVATTWLPTGRRKLVLSRPEQWRNNK